MSSDDVLHSKSNENRFALALCRTDYYAYPEILMITRMQRDEQKCFTVHMNAAALLAVF